MEKIITVSLRAGVVEVAAVPQEPVVQSKEQADEFQTVEKPGAADLT